MRTMLAAKMAWNLYITQPMSRIWQTIPMEELMFGEKDNEMLHIIE